jgi:hypothetical protein
MKNKSTTQPTLEEQQELLNFYNQGLFEQYIDVAKAMLAEHFDVETISRISKLSVFEIEALI